MGKSHFDGRAFATRGSKEKKGIYPKAMEMFYPNFSHDLRAPQKFICSKNNIYGIIPLM